VTRHLAIVGAVLDGAGECRAVTGFAGHAMFVAVLCDASGTAVVDGL
jgi:hypothetical protein